MVINQWGQKNNQKGQKLSNTEAKSINNLQGEYAYLIRSMSGFAP